MKTQIKKIVAAIILLAVGITLNASSGSIDAIVNISTENGKTVILRLNNINESTRISIRNQSGVRLFKDKAETGAYAKVFDLNRLQEGDLYLEIENEERLEVLTIKVTDKEAYLEKSARKLIEKPVLKMKGNMAKVFFGQNEGQTEVVILDSYGNLVYKQNVADSGAKTYDLSDLERGNYKFQFKTGGKTFYNTAKVR